MIVSLIDDSPSNSGWTTITQLISLNTPGYANGLLYLYANDTLALSHTGLTWRTNDSVTLTSVFFSTFFGGASHFHSVLRSRSFFSKLS